LTTVVVLIFEWISSTQGCELIIALTHMRFPNDERLAENVDGIDIILGGHDHVYQIKHVRDKL